MVDVFLFFLELYIKVSGQLSTHGEHLQRVEQGRGGMGGGKHLIFHAVSSFLFAVSILHHDEEIKLTKPEVALSRVHL